MNPLLKHLYTLSLVTFLSATGLHGQLSPEVQADRLILRAQAEMERDEWDRAAATFDEIVKLEVERPVESDYYHARALAKANRVNDAHEVIVRFLSAISRDHPLYVPALELLNEVEPKMQLLADGKEWLKRNSNRIIPGRGIEMVAIPPGGFQMGDENGSSDETPVTSVVISKGFWLGKTTVTQGQWQALMGNNPSRRLESSLGAPTDSLGTPVDRLGAPVDRISWNDAMEFCRKLTQGERAAGRLPEGYEYTLPSEAQWEYVARAGTTTRWSFGDRESQLGDYAWFDGNSGFRTHPVGQKRPNPWGLHDMYGNVWEWCADWYGDYPGGSAVDLDGPSSGSLRVRRGGSWNNSAQNCRSANRHGVTPDDGGLILGFRLALRSVE